MRWLLLPALLLLSSCHFWGGSNSSVITSEDGQILQVPETQGSDPLIAYQWGLYNQGQAVFTSQGGTPAEDMNGFAVNQLTLSNYALGATGRGVEVAVLDTGLEIRHDDLINNVVPDGSYNFSNNNQRLSTDPTNNSSVGDHGTSVAGLIAARGNNSIGLMGVAPKARLRGFNILSYGGLEEELAALGLSSNYDFDLANTGVFNRSYGYNPDIVSDGTDEDGLHMQETLAAIELGTRTLRGGRGAIYVKAGGNEYDTGPNSESYRSVWCINANSIGLTCYNVNQEMENATPYQIVVGAFNAKGKRAPYSNTGSALWISAPAGDFGVSSPTMLTTDQSGCFSGYSKSRSPEVNNDFNTGDHEDNGSCDYYASFNGTSAATPMISGLVALLLEVNPNLKWFEIKHILAKTARKIEPDLADNLYAINSESFVLERGWIDNAAGFHFSNEYGFGAADILAAVQMAKDWKSQNISLGSFTSHSQGFEIREELAIPDMDAEGVSVASTINQDFTVQTLSITLSITGKELDNTFEDSDQSQAMKNACSSRVTDESLENAKFKNKIDASDFWVEVTSPQGTKSVLLTPFNAYRTGYSMPNLTLVSHAFYGESSAGEWQVKIVDVDDDSVNYICHSGQGWLTDMSIKVYGYR